MIGEIRFALASDADAIAQLHVLSWRGSYRGILPDAYLDGDVEAERADAWARYFDEPPPGAVAFVAPGAGQSLDGFIALEAGHERGYDAVIENLHVAPGARGCGLGKKLLATAATHLIGAGGASTCLWVYDANRAAIDFYKAIGGVIDAREFDPFAGADAPHSRIGWRDIRVLRDLCG
jgi:ribosomal protein S18 acetylase RimI-like enzyme